MITLLTLDYLLPTTSFLFDCSPRVGVLILCNPFHSFPSKNTKFSIQVRFEVVRHVIKRQETGKYCDNSSREENVGGLHVRSFYGSTNQFTREKYNKVK